MDLAVMKSFDDHIMPYFNTFTSHDFRIKRMYNEICDLTILKNIQTLREIFIKYSGREGLGGETRYMS